MRNFTKLLLICFLLFSCSKQNEGPASTPGNTSGPAPAKPAPPATKVTITINDTVMNITSLSFGRYGDGSGGEMTITASNAGQKVVAEVFHFYQNGPWDMIYQQQVSYFTRKDSLGDWGGTYTRPIPRDDRVSFNNFTPLSDSVVTGSFVASFTSSGGISKDGQGPAITLKGSFKLVYLK